MASYYFVAKDGIWHDANSWASSSGGAGGAGIPGASDIAYFDATSGDCTLTADAPVSTLRMEDVFLDTITMDGFTISCDKDAILDGGILDMSGGSILAVDDDIAGAPGCQVLGSDGIIRMVGGSTNYLTGPGTCEPKLWIQKATGYVNMLGDWPSEVEIEATATDLTIDGTNYAFNADVICRGVCALERVSFDGALEVAGGAVTLADDVSANTFDGTGGRLDLAGYTLTLAAGGTCDHSTGFELSNGVDASMADGVFDVTGGTLTLAGASGDRLTVTDCDFVLAAGADVVATWCTITASVVTYVDDPGNAKAISNVDGGSNTGWDFEHDEQPGLQWRLHDARPHFRIDDARPHFRVNDARPHFRVDDARPHFRVDDARPHFRSERDG